MEGVTCDVEGKKEEMEKSEHEKNKLMDMNGKEIG